MKFLKIFLAVFILTISSFSFTKAVFTEPTSDLDSVSAPVTSLSPGQIKTGPLNLSWLSVLGNLWNGYVGIGGDANNSNSIPEERLDVKGSVNIHNQILINHLPPSNGQVLHFGYDNVTGSSTMRWGGNYAWINFTSDVKNGACNLNGICDTGETCSNCPGDCINSIFDVCDVPNEIIAPPSCDLDKMCEAANGETTDNCMDCRGCENQGLSCNNNGICEDTLPNNQNEGYGSCSTDCSCGYKNYGIKVELDMCGDGKVDPGEQCDPPKYKKECKPGEHVCQCSESCQYDCFTCPIPIKDTVPPDLGQNGGGNPPGGPGGGSNTCQDNAPTGAPQCGGTCPNPGESCQDNNGGAPGGLCECLGDITAPTRITTLSSSNITSSSITLNWISSGDDGSVGTATSYDIRYSTSPITAGNFSSRTQVSNPPTPLISGTPQSVVVGGLLSNTTYYFAMKVLDEVPNTSLISNLINATTLANIDSTPPGAIANLAATNIGTTVNLTWTAPGDDGFSGTATSYDIRYSTSPITAGNFSSKPQVSNPPTPLVAGTNQSKFLSGLTNGAIYYFAMKTLDEVPNISAISNLIQIEIGSNGGSTPAFNGLNYKNPFAALFNLFNFKSAQKAEAQSGGSCGDTWLPLRCFIPYEENSLDCVDGQWIRSCFKEL